MFSRLLLAATTPLALRTPEARFAWQILLAATGAVMTVTLGCIVPFPAMATLASRTLRPRAAIFALLAAVLLNQAAGFLFLGFPRTFETALWAPVFAAATVAAWLVATRIRQPALALAGSFAVYEFVLAAFTFATTHSLAAFTAPIVGEVALGNAAGLAILCPMYCALVAIERSTDASHARAPR